MGLSAERKIMLIKKEPHRKALEIWEISKIEAGRQARSVILRGASSS